MWDIINLLCSYQGIIMSWMSPMMKAMRRRWKPIWREWQNSPHSNWTHPLRCIIMDTLMYATSRWKVLFEWYSPSKTSFSLKKVDFLQRCGLTTLAHRNELLTQKRRKRRRMMRERSLSPPAVLAKRKASSPAAPTSPLTTPYSAEQMDRTPELEEKKDFLHMVNLSHVSPQQRRGNSCLVSHPTRYSSLFTVAWVIPCG